jgi:hypothetical protein
MILEMLRQVKEKGQVTKGDLMLMNLKHHQLNSEEELDKVTQEDSINILLECE